MTSDILLLRVQALYSKGKLFSVLLYMKSMLKDTGKLISIALHVLFVIEACFIIGYAIQSAVVQDGKVTYIVSKRG